ncbi:MAG: hypothetical protein A2252_02850 [Elusimicrobia bacterium RIFOXYA2_FULL_39_19]|nr:MAG: hypothetical protein A2252_02850 [Elusimicrobia bacterium RIFOXYA2_FULL_39_19]
MILAKFAIERPVTVYMIFIAVIVLGIITLSRLSIDLLPDFSLPMGIVITSYSGAGPSEIESMVSRPIERSLSTAKDLKEMSSYSVEGFSAVMLQFEWGTNMDAAANDIREKLDMVKSTLPGDADNPMIFKFDLSMMPVMVMAVSSPNIPLDKLRYLAEQNIQPQLERLPGVASASVQGGLEREIAVEINRNAMEASGLSIQQVMGAIGAANINLPGGHLKTESSDFVVRTMGQFKKPSELENVVVGNQRSAPIYLRSIAKIKDTFAEKTSDVKVNKQPSVVVMVQKSPGANTVSVSDNVKKALLSIKKDIPEGVNIVPIMDSSVFIRKSISRTERSAVEGAFLAIIIILLFLRSVSSTFIVSTAIPISLIAAFILMYFQHMSLNIVTMGGLALGVGRLVDDAIVVIESIFRHRQKTEDPGVAAVEGTSEVSMAVLSSTITTVVVFAPLLFVSGLAGIMFKPMAYTIVLSLGASYFVAMVLIPLLSSKFLKRIPEDNEIIADPGKHGIKATWGNLKAGIWLQKVDAFYHKVLKWCLRNRKKTIFIVIGCFIITLPLLPFLGTEFIPASDEGEFQVSINLPVGTKLEKTKQVVDKIENIIKENVPELKSIYSTAGVEGKGFAALRSVFGNMTGSHSSTFRIQIVERAKRKRSTKEVVEVLRKKLADLPDADVKFIESGGMMGGFGSSDPIVVEIRGFDMDTAKKLAEEVVKTGKTIKGMRDMKINREDGLPELQVEINREKAASLGLSVAQIGKTIQNNIDGSIASLYRDEILGKEFYINVRLQKTDRQNSPDLGNVFITSPLGKQIALSNVARINKGLGPIKIERKNQERILLVTGQVYGVPPGTVASELEKRIKRNIIVPVNFMVSVTGAYKDQVEAFRNLLFALLLSITLVYMVMAAQFESLLDPFIIMFSVPLGAIGVIWGLFLTGHTLSVISFIGIIMMSGIVVSNAILLVDYTNTLRRKYSMEIEEALITAGRTRLRPVLMTTLTTIMGMLPLALGLGEGSEMSAPMAVSVVGGLAVSTVLTLVFIPTLYYIVEKRIKKTAV